MLFTQTKGKLTEIKEVKFGLEKHLQALVEENIQDIFGLEFVSTEFQLQGLRIDTLAFDLESKSFIIIEYKRDRSFSIIDQGYAYLSLMLNNKADFILEYQEKNGKLLKKSDISRSETKVIFVANSFTIHQRQAINFRDLPIELREAKKHKGEIYAFNHIKATKHTESIKTISKDNKISQVSKEIKAYTLEDHLKPDRTNTKDLFEELREQILNLDERLEENFVKLSVGYKIGKKVVVLLKLFKSKIRIEYLRVRPQDLKDSESKLVEMKNAMKYYNKHVSYIDIANSDDIQYSLLLAKQLLNKLF